MRIQHHQSDPVKVSNVLVSFSACRHYALKAADTMHSYHDLCLRYYVTLRSTRLLLQWRATLLISININGSNHVTLLPPRTRQKIIHDDSFPVLIFFCVVLEAQQHILPRFTTQHRLDLHLILRMLALFPEETRLTRHTRPRSTYHSLNYHVVVRSMFLPSQRKRTASPVLDPVGALHCRIEAPLPHQQHNFYPIYIYIYTGSSPVGSALRRRKPSMDPIILCLEAESDSEVCPHPFTFPPSTSTSNVNFNFQRQLIRLQRPTSTCVWSIHSLYPHPNTNPTKP
jgi:hypothetical protein